MQKLIKTKKILAVILCIVLILTNVNITFANTNYDSRISLEDNSIHLTENSVSDEQDSQSKIDKKINFGTIEKGDTVEPAHFELVNDEDHDIKIKWTETEENSPFNIAVSSDTIPTGEKAEITISPRADIESGEHNTTIVFQDTENSASSAVVAGNIEVKEKEPASSEEEKRTSEQKKETETSEATTEKEIEEHPGSEQKPETETSTQEETFSEETASTESAEKAEVETEKKASTENVSDNAEATTEKKAVVRKSPKKAPPIAVKGSSDSPEYTITYKANGGFFEDPGNDTNVVSYQWGPLPNEKYSHTFNLDDEGNKLRDYNHGMNTPGEVVTFPDASKLKVTITWGGESASYDWACMWKGAHPEYRANNNYSSSVTGKLGGGNHTATSNTKTWTVDDSSVTFSFRSDGSGVGDGYGYYAVITPLDANGDPISIGDGNNIQSGKYISPRQPGKVLDGWYTDAECTQPYGDIIRTQLSDDITLYAKYKDDDWYSKYTYTLDETTHEIKLTRYNGNDVNVTLPSKAIINGVEYSTVIDGPVYQNKSNIGSITFDEGVKSGENIKQLFYGCSNLENIKFRDFDTSAATNMSGMFYGCSRLASLDVSNFNTSNATDMNNMFYGCTALTSLDVSNFNTGNVTHMGGMFYNCNNLTNLNVSGLDTSKVENMANMFYSCKSLTSLDVSSFNTEKVNNTASMFYNCAKLTSLDVSHFDTGTVTNMASMFANCSALTSLDVSNFNTANVTNMQSMFSGCSKLTSLDVSDFNTGKVTNMDSMFNGCSSLTMLDVSGFDTKNVTSMSSMFASCSKLTSLDVTHFDTEKVKSFYSMFYNCSSLQSLDCSSWNTGTATNMARMFYSCLALNDLDVRNFNTANVTDMNSMFSDCRKLPSLDASSFNTGKVTNMSAMFNNCYVLKPIDVTNFNTSNVTNMSSMFANCREIETLDVSNFNTGKVTSMSSMFYGDSKLKNLDVSGFNTANVTSFSQMFRDCKVLEEINVSGFNTAKATNMSYMFNNCAAITELDLSNFNTAKVTNMAYMFSGCSNMSGYDVSSFNTAIVTDMQYMFNGNTALTELDLSNFDTGKVTTFNSMFSSNPNLQSLDISSFNTANATNFALMFYNCKSLKEIDVSDFNTAKATNMNQMFTGCSSVETLDVSSFNTAKVTNMNSMFNGCNSLDEIDVSNFKMNSISNSNTSGMFNSTSLKKITIGPDFKFKASSTFPSGNWFKGDTDVKYSATELYQQYNSSMADTYNRELVVTFNPVGGRVDTKKHYVTYDKEITQLPNATKIGYQFVGWFTEKKDGEQIHVGDHYRQDTYYAHWDPNHYTLRLNPNGGQGDVKNIPMAYDDTCQLSAAIFQRPGWEIYEWNTQQDGSGTSYAPDDEVTMLTSGDGDVVTLYAQWSNDWINITFDSDGGAEVPMKHIVKGKKLGSLYEPAKEGCQFMGWYTEPNGAGTKITTETIPAQDMTYYAYWQENPVVTFDSGTDTSQKIVPYGKAVNVLPEPHRNNYVFDGWYTEPNGQGTKVTKDKIITEDVTFYANWLLRPVFDPSGGIITVPEDDSNYGEKDPTHFILDSFPTASKPGYDFLGWADKNGNILHIGDAINLYEGSTIYALWNAHETINVTFDGNGAANPAPIKLFKNQPIGALPHLTRTNKKFLGWFTEDGTPVTEAMAFSEDVTIHAEWENLIQIQFDSNGGSTVTPRKVESGSTMNTIPGCRRSGYILEGWYDKDGNKLDESTVFTKPVTYTARWILETNEGADESINYVYSASWSNASNENLDNVNGNLEFHPTDSSTQTAQLHIRFELNRSIDRTLPVGSVNIKIPKTVFENWDGEPTGTNDLSFNLPRYPDVRAGMYFSYIEQDDSYILTNNVEIPGGAGVDLTVHYTVDPRQVPGGAMDYDNEYIDGYPYYQKEFPVTFTIDKDMNGTIDVDKEIDLSLEMHTRVRTRQSKNTTGVYYKWNENWGPKPSDGDNYFYVVWRLDEEYLSTTNQPSTYRWSEDTVHDGTVVKMTNNTVITKHPNSLLQDLNESGLVIYNEAIVTEDWKSGYSTPHRVSASTIIRDRHYPTGEFTKRTATSDHLIDGGQEDIVDEQKDIAMPYELIYDGSSYNLDTMPVPDGEGYTKKPRTITFEDGIHGDIMYSSGSPNNKYVWEPDTGNVILGDSDYYFRDIRINLTEYDSTYRNGAWTSPLVSNDTTQYDNVEIWVRLANQDEFVKYKTILGTNNSTIQLPERTVGFKVVHNSAYYATKLVANATLMLRPTQKVMSLISNDVSEKTTSVIKNIARCTIADTNDDVFFHVTNRTADTDSAYKELYELNVSRTDFYVYKDSANTESVKIDVNRGTQDNPMVIYAYNRNNAGRKKLLNNVVFHDLLPMGTTVDEDSIYGRYFTNTGSVNYYASNYNKNNANINRNYYNVEFIENWEDSRRTMMIITANLPKTVKNTGMAFYYMLHNTYENIVENGTVLENDVSCANIAEGHVPPDSTNGQRSLLAHKDQYLNLERQYEGDIGFAKATTHYRPIDAFSWGFFKTVKTDADYVEESEVYRNSIYTYRLTYSQSDYAKSDRLIFFDILEAGTDTKTSYWHGTFDSVNTESIAQKKSHNSNVTCNPVVYYSTKPREEFTGYDFSVENTETWSREMPANKADVTAIAIDCRKNTDGTDFVMMGKQAINAYINMKSPAHADKIGLSTTNGAVSMARKYASGVPEDESTKEEADCTVTIKDFQPEVHKTSTPGSGTQEEPTKIDLGETVKYNISVKNKDAVSTLYDVVVEDPIPDNMIVNNSAIEVYTDNPNHSIPVQESTRISFTREGRNLRFVIKELIPNETMHFIIPAVSDGNHVIYANKASIISVNDVEKEVESETVYHKTNFWPINVFKKIGGSDSMLAGATLKIATTGGQEIKTWTTQDGSETINLIPGDYILTELEAPDGYVKADPITIHVPEDGNITTNPANALSGENNITMYDAPKKSITLKKETHGNFTDSNDTFKFQFEFNHLEKNQAYPVTMSTGVLLDGGTTTSISSDAEGSKSFMVELKAGQTFTVNGLPPEMTYQIREIANSYTASYQINAGEYGTTVTPSDENVLSGVDLQTSVETLDIVDSDTVITFDNVRNMKYGHINLQGKKFLDGETLTENQFEFDLFNPDGEIIETKKNDSQGMITFSQLNYDASDISHTYVYQIREKTGTRNDLQYDTTPVYAVVTVNDTPTLDLDVQVTYRKGEHDTAGSSTALFHNYKKTDVTLHKKNPNGASLAGAELQLLDHLGNVIESWSDADHVVKLITGDYVFHEKNPPIGYSNAPDIPISVKPNGDVFINGEKKNEVTMTDPERKGSIKIHKTDYDDTDMKDVVFALYNSSGTELQRKTTNNEGIVIFENLDMGQYTVMEKKTAYGHSLLAASISVTLPLAIDAQNASNINEEEAVLYQGKYYFYDLTYEIKNMSMLNVPLTGKNPFIYTGILAAIFLLIGYRLRRKKEENY